MRNRRKRAEIAASEQEIAAMTAELEELHHDVATPALEAHVAAWRDEVASLPRSTSRRTFLIGAGGALAGGAALAALAANPGLAAAASKSGSQSSSSSSKNPPNAKGGITDLHGDLAVAALAASLENLAVYAYGQGIAAAKAGKLGTVPPAVVTFATTARRQHHDHAEAWNAILKASHKHAVTVTTPSLTPTVNHDLSKVTNVTDLANLALTLENSAAQTYQVQAAKLHAKKAIETASTIQPVEMQHAAILYYALGKYPGVQDSAGNPLAFNPTSEAVS